MKYLLLICVIFSSFSIGYSSDEGTEHTLEEKAFDPGKMIMHHIKDAHEMHWWGEGHSSVSWPLPVILWTKNGLTCFSSSNFNHDDEGKVVVNKNGNEFIKVHGKIYYANATGEAISMGPGHAVLNEKPLDFSVTKNVVGMFLVILILFLVFKRVAKDLKTGSRSLVTRLFEPIVIFVRDEIAKINIGATYKKYVPYLLTVFFFIWFLNMLGLTPLGFNVTGNIAFTLILSLASLLLISFSANKYYWKHIFNPDVPIALKPLMVLVEIIGVFVKPFALMMRLFANITGGHIVVLSVISLIFIAKAGGGSAMAWGVSPASMLLVVLISVLEVLVAVLQAYIFTLLTAIFIGMAVEEHH